MLNQKDLDCRIENDMGQCVHGFCMHGVSVTCMALSSSVFHPGAGIYVGHSIITASGKSYGPQPSMRLLAGDSTRTFALIQVHKGLILHFQMDK